MDFNKKSEKIIINFLFIILMIGFLLPFVILVSSSLSSETDIIKYGYPIISRKIDLSAYKYIFENGGKIFTAYGVTAFVSVVATIGVILNELLIGYTITRSKFKARKFFTYAIFFTMLFSGGLVPSYILTTRYLHLQDTIWVYIIPSLMPAAWQIFMIKNFFSGLAGDVLEAAKIDGASEFRVFWNISIPLVKPIIAVSAFGHFMGQWNGWMTSMLYINRKTELYTIQYLLQQMMSNAELLTSNEELKAAFSQNMIPSETIRFAMAVIVALPVLAVFPFFQKYFEKGMVVGSVKG